MPTRGRGGARSVGWSAAVASGAVLCSLVARHPVLALVALGLGIQLVVSALAWPAVERAVRSLTARVLPAAVGWVVIVVALDWSAGWVLHGGTAGDESPPLRDLAHVDLPATDDPHADSLAMAGLPWVERYFEELDALRYRYVPYVGPRLEAVRGRYINSAGGIRRSYQPEGADQSDALEVWFFGGSTLWGEGQRDLHTIPSEVARLAEDDGIIVRPVNYGERGYTAFQELLLFEQQLALRPAPDVVVFYHGVNEQPTLLETPESLGPQPAIFEIETTRNAFERAPPLPGAQPLPEPSGAGQYVETSALHKLWRRVSSLASVEAAGAQPSDEVPSPEEHARATDYAEAIYRRSIDLVRHLADEHDLDPVMFWQPRELPNDPYLELGARLADEVVDVSRALADPPAPVFLDGVHTNEVGARIVAEALYPHLRPVLERGVEAR